MVTEELVEGRVPDGLVHDVFLVLWRHVTQPRLPLTKVLLAIGTFRRS